MTARGYLQYSFELTLLTAVYYLSAQFGLFLEVHYGGVTPIWPPSGIAVAVLWRMGLRCWPMVVIGEFCVALSLHQPIPAGIIGGSAQLMEAMAAVYLMRWRGVRRLTSSGRAVLLFTGLGVLLPPVLSASIGASTLWLFGFLPSDRYVSGWLTWWLGDAVGILVLGPFLAGVDKATFSGWKPIAYWILSSLAMLGACAAIILLADERCYYLFFLLIPFVIFAAIHFRLLGAGSSAILLALVVFGMRLEDLVKDDFITAVRMTFVGTCAFTGYLVTGFIERRKSREALIERQKAYFDGLHDISLGLISHLELNQLLEAIVSRATGLLQTHHGFYYQWDGRSETIELKVGRGIYAKHIGYRVAADMGMVGTVWKTGKPLVVNDYQSWKGRHPDPMWDSVKAAIGVPLKIDFKVIGVIGLLHTEKNRYFSEEELGILKRFGELASVAWENARLYTELSDQFHARKRTERALATSERNYREIFNATREALLMLEVDSGRILEANASALEMFGYTYEEIRKLDFEAVSLGTSPYSRTEGNQWLAKAGQGEAQLFEWRALNKNQEALWLEITLKKAVINERKRLIAVARNIESRKRTEARLQQLFTAIEFAAEDIMITDIDGVILYVNPAFERVTGYTKDEAIGRTPRLLKSGMQSDSLYKDLWDTISSGKVWTGRLMNKRKDGGIILQEANIAPIKDGSDEIVGFVSVKRDITDQERLKKQLVQSQKMEAIGTLAGGIAHDFNNILAAIIGYTEVALNYELHRGHPAAENMRQVLKAGKRASELVKQILTFSRSVEIAPEAIDVRPIIKEVVKLLRASLPSTIDIRLDMGGALCTIWADPTHVHQIVMNLCTNAAHSMEPSGGSLEINVSNIRLTSTASHLDSQLEPGGYLELCVSDTGEGIAPDAIEKIFEPYFTTKQMGKGTGLGLAVVHGIVKGLNGAIIVESKPGKGAQFKVYLPCVDESTKPKPAESSPIPLGNEHILFIDDEPGLVDLGRQMLERLGYTVTAVDNSTAALEVFRTMPHAFDLVITDMTMPKMTGDELSREILKIRPETPVIVCTGYSEKLTEAQAVQMGIKAVVLKPLNLRSIAELVRKILDDQEK